MATKPCRVLVVDDDQDTAQTLAYLLVGMGHEATFLTDPHSVLETIDRVKPHIVLMDIGMPTMSGWEVARGIRKKYSSDELQLVAISGQRTDQAFHVKIRAAGFDAHVAKPIQIELLESIMKQLAGYRP